MNYLVDPDNITNFDRSLDELELNLIWWIMAAGKNGHTSAKLLNNFLIHWSKYTNKYSPFYIFKYVLLENNSNLSDELRKFGFGCYNTKSKSILDLVHSGIDLMNCSVLDLEGIRGIGPKTARCFLIHNRPDQNFAGLDTHILKYLRSLGYDAPNSTPSGKKYLHFENIFINMAKKMNETIASLDLKIWTMYRKKA